MKILLINMVVALMMSAKLVTLSVLKIKVFWNWDDDVTISVHDVSNKILLRESIYIVDVAMWPKFGNSNISMRGVIITSTYNDLTRKNNCFESCSWFKFNNLGLALSTALKVYTSVTKGLKLVGEGRGAFFSSWSWIV